jgi:RHS repeat-associated protein
MRSVYPTPSGFTGRIATRDYLGRPVALTPDIDCGSDEHCDVVPPAGVELVRTYDGLGRVTSIVSPDAGTTTIDYAAFSYPSPPVSGLSGGTYDLVKLFFQDGRVEHRIHDGERQAVVKECGFDLGCSGSTVTETTYEYTPAGEVARVWNAKQDFSSENNRLAYTFDTLGRIREIDDPDGGTTSQTYDLVGNLDTLTNGRGEVSDYTFDALDRLVSIDRPGTEPTITIQYHAHTRNNLLTYVGSDVVTGHNYDDFGRERRKVVVSHGVTLITDFEYDLLGRVEKVTYPDHTVMNYDYEGAYLESVCAENGECTGDKIWVSDVAYDALGRETSIIDKHGTRGFEYDPTTYQLTRKYFHETDSDEDWLDLQFAYDGSGRIEEILDTHDGIAQDGIDASASFTYDARSRLESWDWNGSQRWFTYDELSNLTGRSLAESDDPPNQIYADPTRPHSITSRTDTGKVYEHDADGNVTRRGGQYLSYTSDNQLQCVGTAAGLCDIASFGYDAEGTLAYETAGGVTRIFVEDLFVWDASINQALSRVFANGREIGEHERSSATLRTAWLPPGFELPFEPGDLILAVLATAGLVVLVLAARSGAVAAARRRPWASSATVLTSLSLLVPSPGWAGGGNGTVTRRFTYQDQLGTRVLLVSDTPEVIYRRVFEPFGEVVAESVGTEGHRAYLTGKRESTATRDGSGSGLVHFGARWYDPEIGRFQSIDPIVQDLGDPQTHNPYSYVRNNPARFVDPDGFGSKVFDRIIGAIGIYVGFIFLFTPAAAAGALMIVAGVGRILSTNGDPDVAAAGRLVEAVGALGVGLAGGSSALFALTRGFQGGEGALLANAGVAADAVETAKAAEGVAKEAGRGDPEREPLWVTIFRHGVFDYKEPLGGSYVLEGLSAVGPGRIFKAGKLAVRAGKAFLRKLDPDIVKKITRFNKRSLREQLEEFETLAKTYAEHLKKYGQKLGETTGETNRMERELKAMEEILRDRGQLGGRTQ